MAIITKAVSLETTQQNLIQAIIAKQSDCNSRFLKVTFLNEGVTIPLESSSKVTINAERKDGASKSFFGVVNEDNTATVPLHSWILELDGTVNCDISIIGTDESRLTTTGFVVLVEKAANSGEDISTDPQYDVLANLIESVNTKGVCNALKGFKSGTKVVLEDVSPLEHEIKVKLSTKMTEQYICPLSDHGNSWHFENGDGDYTIVSVEDGNSGEYLVCFDDEMSYCECWWEYNTSYTPAVGDVIRYKQNDEWGEVIYLLEGFSGDPTTVTVTVSGVSESINLGGPGSGDVGGTCFDSGETEFVVDYLECYDDGYGYIYFTDGNYYTGPLGNFSSYNIKAGDQTYISYTYDEAYGEDMPELYLRRGEYKKPVEYTPNADGTVLGIVGDGSSITISNDKDAVMEVEYNIDINKAFQSLLNALSNVYE